MTHAPGERLTVIVNAGGGAAAHIGRARLEADVREAFDAAGTTIDLLLLDGDGLIDAARRAIDAGATAIVIGGGDGSINCVAHLIAGSDVALGVLPLGTLNHFARDLGLSGDLAEAAQVIAAGQRARIDIGRVNDRSFVNNFSIGMYPAMVLGRDAEQRRRRLPKWLATIPSALGVLRRLSHHRLRVRLDGREDRAVTTPLLFVGNNHYAVEGAERGQRATLTDGKLSVYALRHRSRAGLIWTAIKLSLGRSDRRGDFELAADVLSLEIDGERRRLTVALDGEVASLALPLRLRCDPGALIVLAPATPPG